MAILSEITPPVAIAAFVAAAIAGAPHMKVCFTGLRLGMIIFLLPWLFIYNPGLLLIGSPIHIVIVYMSILPGVILFAFAMGGWAVRNLTIVERFLCAFLAILFFIRPGSWITLLGLGCLFTTFLFLKNREAEVGESES